MGQGESKSVNPGSLHSLFERLFGGDDAPTGRDCAHPTADLTERLDDGRDGGGELADTPERSTALLAAYLDGGLDEAAQQEVAARLAGSPSAYHDAAGADAFLAAVAGAQLAAPADLVASTIARARPSPAPMARQRPMLWKWSAALAVLAAAIAVVVVITHQPMPAARSAPMTAKSLPPPAAAPQGPVLAQPQAPEGKLQTPAMLPAGGETVAPMSQDCKGSAPCPKKPVRPQLAPEAEDTMPLPPSRRH